MSNYDASNTIVAAGGDVWLAPVGTAPPDDDAAPGVGWVNVGYVSEDGVTISPDVEVTDFYAWQGWDPIRSELVRYTLRYSFDLLEVTAETLPLAFGGGVSDTGVYTPPGVGDTFERALLIDVVDGDRTYRWVTSRVRPVDLGEVTFGRGEMARLPVTLGVLADPDGGTPWELRHDLAGL